MKRIIIAVLLLVMLSVGVPTVYADDANWDLCGFQNNSAYVYYTININSLQVSSFTAVNNSDHRLYMRILEDDELIFEIKSEPNTTQSKDISGFKFKRVPATDHDDPNSVRYPSGVQMGCQFPSLW